MTKKLKFVRAKAQAQVFGAFPEGIINAAVSKGVEIWNLERLDSNTLRFELMENDIATIRELAKRCSLELKVTCLRDESRRMLKKRFILLPLLGIMGLLTIASSLFVWQIDVYGLGSISRGKVMRSLEESGLRPGTFWPGLKADDIRSRLMLDMPEIAWMTVNVSGSRAKVLINERVDKPEIYNEANPADLVAGKTGLVRRVSVLSGDAAVQPSQAVTEGEMLASGSLNSIMGRERSVRARGTVMADTWYEIDGICPEQLYIKSPGMFTRHRFAVILGKRRINFYFSSGKAIDECDKIISEYTVGIDGHFAFPIRLVHERIVSYASQPGPGYDGRASGRIAAA